MGQMPDYHCVKLRRAFERNVRLLARTDHRLLSLQPVERFAATCRHACPHRRQFLTTETIEGCQTQCELQLTTPASVVWRSSWCALSTESIQTCEMANAQAPSCELGCLRVFECSREANPFGLSPSQFDACINDCNETSTPESRQCSFETPCDENYLNAFYECLETVSP